MSAGSRQFDGREDSEPRVGFSKPFWKAMLISFFLFWAFDLLSSGMLISEGFGRLEYNVFVRLFFQAPTSHHLYLFFRDQVLYLIPLVLAASAPVLEFFTKGQEGNQLLYIPTAIVVFLYAIERLDLGIASNAANLFALMVGQPVPASSLIFYILLGGFDVIWAVWAWSYVSKRKDVLIPPLPNS